MRRLLLALAVTLHVAAVAQEARPEPRRDLRGAVTGLDAGVARVTLWRNDMKRASVDLLGDVRTAADGRFRLDDVPWVEGFDWGFNTVLVLAQTDDRVGVRELRGDAVALDRIEVALEDAIELRGTLRDDERERPIADAAIWVGMLGEVAPGRDGADAKMPVAWLTAPLPLWRVRTDSAGRFVLRGLPRVAPIQLRVDHDDYADEWLRVEDPQAPWVGTLRLGGRIAGTVVMPDGSPAVRVVVAAAGRGSGHGRTVTDEHGRFRLTGLAPDVYKVWAEARDLTVIAVADLDVGAGTEIGEQRIRLVHGGFVVGRLVDAATGAAIAPGPHTDVAMYGPARPRGGACECTPVQADGTFRIRAPAGSNFVYLRGLVGWSEASETVEVRDGQETAVVWRLARANRR